MNESVSRFIGESVDPIYESGGGFEKKPLCPDAFVWRREVLRIAECLSEWKDYSRRGKMAHNMRELHLAAAAKRGSRGVGRHYFRVRVDDGRVFDLYYDRAPKSGPDGKGSWHLLRELLAESGHSIGSE
jgi:hypothetical protein